MVKDRADERINTLSSTASPETQRRLTGIMAKVKEGAEKAKEELENAKRELEKRAGALDGVAGANGNKDSAGKQNCDVVYFKINDDIIIKTFVLIMNKFEIFFPHKTVTQFVRPLCIWKSI